MKYPTFDGSYRVYHLLDAQGQLLYIGCTSDLHVRMINHRNKKEWADQISDVTWNVYPTHDAGFAVEAAELWAYEPPHNVKIPDNPMRLWTAAYEAEGFLRMALAVHLAHLLDVRRNRLGSLAAVA